MSTTIHSSVFKTPLTLTPYLDAVELVIGGSGASYNRSDFIAAVEKGLNGIFISKNDLPKAFIDIDGYISAKSPEIALESRLPTVNTKNLRKRAYALLAIAEYADTHPPVDEQQVEALAGLIQRLDPSGALKTVELARDLLATGKVTVSD